MFLDATPTMKPLDLTVGKTVKDMCRAISIWKYPRSRITTSRFRWPFLKAPDIVILDEATAHLDSESEAAIQQAFEIALRGRTSLVIAHRLSTILKADQILVVQDGRIVERGTHAELVGSHGFYAELHRMQFARRE